MPRFFPKKYDPLADSAGGGIVSFEEMAAMVRHQGGIVLARGAGDCRCGCGDRPKGPKSVFCMGHDARLRGRLLRAHLMGVQVHILDGEGVAWSHEEPLREAHRHGWENTLLEAEAARDAKNAAVVKTARDYTGRKVLVKVGRWEYTGQVAAIYDDGEEFEIDYVTRTGERKRTRVAKGKVTL